MRKIGEKVSRRSATVTEMPLRSHRSVERFIGSALDNPDDEVVPSFRRSAVRVSFSGGIIPQSSWGRVAASGGLLLLLGGVVAGVFAIRSFLVHDSHFIVESPSFVEIAGNSHLSRAQLLSVFGEDVERNIFRIPLEERRAQLESLPWVKHATVMRLLPGRIRVSILERTPIAFVRQGRQVGLVDDAGVLLDFGSGNNEEAQASKYSFPVVLGITQADPPSTRSARMHLYQEFVAALDAGGERLSNGLSEIDISEPDDVRAMVPDASGGDLLVHFGRERYLERYHRYQEHLPEWKQQYPNLASVDLRYDQQAVLQMRPGTSTESATGGSSPAPASPTINSAKIEAPLDTRPGGASIRHAAAVARSSAQIRGTKVGSQHASPPAPGHITGKAPAKHTGAGTTR